MVRAKTLSKVHTGHRHLSAGTSFVAAAAASVFPSDDATLVVADFDAENSDADSSEAREPPRESCVAYKDTGKDN